MLHNGNFIAMSLLEFFNVPMIKKLKRGMSCVDITEISLLQGILSVYQIV